MRRSDDVRPGGVDLRVDRERRLVDRPVAVHDLPPVVADQQQVLTRMWPKCIPNGFTQKWSVNSGSRAVMCPATPSSKPNRLNNRKAAARFCLRCNRSSSTVRSVRGEEGGDVPARELRGVVDPGV